MSPKTRILLYVSLGLNALVICAVAAALLFGMSGTGPSQGGKRAEREGRPFGGPAIIGFARGLDREQRRTLGRMLAQDPVLREGRARLRQSRGNVVAALRTDPLNEDALRAAFEAQVQLQGALAGRGIEALIEIVADLPPEDRAALATAMERSGRGRR